MKRQLSQHQLGERIAEIRKAKGLTQEDLSKLIEISRPSIVQIEQGNRQIHILELQKLSEILGFSIDEFMSSSISTWTQLVKPSLREKRKKERIAAPMLQLEKCKNVLLCMLEHCAGKPNIGESSLSKLLYFCDFNYYELYEEQLTGAEYRKLSTGPALQALDAVVHTMIEDNQIQRVKSSYLGKPHMRLIPLVKTELRELKASEKDVIDSVIKQMSDWSASSLSQYALQDLPCKATKESSIIDYELVFYREIPYSVRSYKEEE